MGQVYSLSRTARSPMSIVRAHWTPHLKNHPIYFRPGQISGPGFGDDNPAILAELVPLLGAISASMEGANFFISMIPEANYSFANACIADVVELPAFGQAFAPIASVLVAQQVQNDCDIEISVHTGRGGRLRDPTIPFLELSVYELIPAEFGRYTRQRLRLPVALDASSAECRPIFAWYAGAAHGVVCWTWKRAVDVQSTQVLATSSKIIA